VQLISENQAGIAEHLGTPSINRPFNDKKRSYRAMHGSINRRNLLKGAAASLVIPFTVEMAAGPARAGGKFSAYLSIASNNTTTVFIGATEMGNGIMTGMAQLVAEELQLDWKTVKGAHGLPVEIPAGGGSTSNPYRNPLFGMQLTGGSTSMRGWYGPLRDAAALAREKLIAAAEQTYPALVPFKVAGGSKLSDKNGALYNYSEFVAAASSITSVTSATRAGTTNYIGKNLPRVDIPAKTNGSAIFGIDVRLPNMVYGAVLHCPTLGGTVVSAPTSAAGALGVYNLGNAVAVLAGDTWSAIQIANSLKSVVTWNLPSDLTTVDSTTLIANGQTLSQSTTVETHVYETAGSPDASYASAPTHVDQTYNLPFLAHAPMEVMNCTADVTPSSCTLWAPTQAQEWCLFTAAAITGLTPGQIAVHTTYLGGGFGRKIEQDYVSQAITLSKLAGRPVKLTWSREQDFGNDKYRPCATIRVRLSANASGAMNALIYRNVSPSINIQRATSSGNNPEDTGAVAGALGLPYNIANRRIEFVPNQTDIPLGYWRSVGESYNIFAVESAIDELALALKADPLAFRKRALGADPRALGVVRAVGNLSSWSTALPAGTARGMAFMKGFGSYIALVVEIKLVNSNIRVTKAYCAIDCGIAVNPRAIEAQMQSGIGHGLSAALWGQITFAKGVPSASNFNKYKVAKMADMPDIKVKVMSSAESPGGVGEVGVPCVAPAIANAYASLTGTRTRSLPFYPGQGLSEL
jgi:isoquinoline 1-oxidoreductase subunit beta